MSEATEELVIDWRQLRAEPNSLEITIGKRDEVRRHLGHRMELDELPSLSILVTEEHPIVIDELVSSKRADQRLLRVPFLFIVSLRFVGEKFVVDL